MVTAQANGNIATATTATAAQIKAHGEVQVKLKALNLLGIALVIMLIGLVAAYLVSPSGAERLWSFLGPVVGGTVTSLSAGIFGRKS